MLGKQAHFCKFGNVIAQCVGKGLQKRAAAGGTGLIEEDIVNGATPNLKALHVLSANVDNEIHVGHKGFGGSKVSHRFHNAVFNSEGIFQQLFAVTGHCTGNNMNPGMFLIELQ